MRLPSLFVLLTLVALPLPAAESWTRHVVYEGGPSQTAIAADFTGDGLPDVVTNSAGKTRLLVAPDWKERIIHDQRDFACIHSEVLDVDGDGDIDWIGARYNPGLILWLENPGNDTVPWKSHLIDDQVHGIHGLLLGDVDLDGRPDLIANGAQPKGDFAESVVWYRTPATPGGEWKRYVAADHDAPGLTHYLGLGDINADGRPDLLTAAKGGPGAPEGTGDWFGWWEAPADPTQRGWKKHIFATGEPGATNLIPAQLNGDGAMDVVASRGHGKGLLWFEGPDLKPHQIDTELVGPHCLVAADLDQDGDIDAATCAKDSKIPAWFENNGRGGFTRHDIGADQAAYDIRAIDMDRDGDLDLLIAGQASENVVWYENPLR